MGPIEPHSRNPTLSIENRIKSIRERINNAALDCGQKPESIRLVAVSKTIPVDVINLGLNAGLTELGENRIQEAHQKREGLVVPQGQSVIHHFLGSLQTNKVRKAVQLFDVIQSVDRPKLAGFVDRVAGEEGKIQSCLIEIKVSSEENKTGIGYEEAGNFISSFSQYKNLNLQGLMAVAPFDRGEKETRACFAALKKFFDSQKKYLGQNPVLSIGMTDDFEWAIKEGSTMVRIGRAIFGERT